MQEVRIIAEGALVKLPSGAVQKYPIGWIGAVDPAIADVWLQYHLAATTVVERADLTAEQKRVLAAAADEIIAQVAAAEIAAAQAGVVEAGAVEAPPEAPEIDAADLGDVITQPEDNPDGTAVAPAPADKKRRR